VDYFLVSDQWFRSYLGYSAEPSTAAAQPDLQLFIWSRLCDRSDSLHFIYGGPVALIESLGLSPHLYADDTQIYGSCTPSHVDMFLSEVTNCVAAVADWMQSNRLQVQLDDNKIT